MLLSSSTLRQLSQKQRSVVLLRQLSSAVVGSSEGEHHYNRVLFGGNSVHNGGSYLGSEIMSGQRFHHPVVGGSSKTPSSTFYQLDTKRSWMSLPHTQQQQYSSSPQQQQTIVGFQFDPPSATPVWVFPESTTSTTTSTSMEEEYSTVENQPYEDDIYRNDEVSMMESPPPPPTPTPTPTRPSSSTLQMMNRNARRPKKANHGKRPCSRVGRRAKRRAFGNHRRK